MKVLAIATFVALAAAQVTINPDGTATCPSSTSPQAFCAGTSLQTNIIIRCVGTVGQAGNCNDNLAGVPPVGVKVFAPCYQSSATAGNAACSFNGVAYPDNGTPFNINGTSTSSSSTTITTSTVGSLSTGSAVGTGGVATGGLSPTGGSGSGGSPGGYNATGSGSISGPTATPTLAVGAAASNAVTSLVVVLAMSVFALAL